MLRTERLLLRPWREGDREAWAALNADPEVMAHFPSVLTRAEADAAFDRIAAAIDDRGWGLWAVDVNGAFLGFTGLQPVPADLPFAPALEVGWRLARSAWGHGYATEAARAALGVAFEELGYDEVVSMTAVTNERSRRVMERLGMTHDAAADFDHPRVPEGPLRRHVLYRLPRADHARRKVHTAAP